MVLELGIDDYVTKPFSPKELMARIKAVTKRIKGEDKVVVDKIEINKLTREVKIDGERCRTYSYTI
jgi:two-component system response regulator ResD